VSAPELPGPRPAELRCPRCSARIAPEQDWCLECGAPARTRLAQTPNWRLPVAVVATVAVLAGLALAVAFAELTGDDAPVTAPATQTAPAGAGTQTVDPGQTGSPNVTQTAVPSVPTTAAPPAVPGAPTAPGVGTPPASTAPTSTVTLPAQPQTTTSGRERTIPGRGEDEADIIIEE